MQGFIKRGEHSLPLENTEQVLCTQGNLCSPLLYLAMLQFIPPWTNQNTEIVSVVTRVRDYFWWSVGCTGTAKIKRTILSATTPATTSPNPMDGYATHTGLNKCRLDSLHRIHQKIFFHPHPCLHRVLSCPQSPAAACQWGYYPPSSSALGTAPHYWWTRPGQCHKSWTQLGGRGRGGKRLMTYKRCVCVCVDVTLVLQVSCHDQTVQNLAYACAYLVVQISHACKAYTRHRFCNLCTTDLQTWYQGRYVHVCVLHVGMCICCVYESVHTPVLQHLIARQDLLILEGSTSDNDLSLDHYQNQ